MRSTPSQSDAPFLAHGLNQTFSEILAGQEGDSLAKADEYQRLRDLPEDMIAYVNRIIDGIMDQDPHAYSLDPSPPSSFSPPPPSPPPPSPPRPSAWDRVRACVVNATNTYWSYGSDPGCSQESRVDLADGQRVYMKQLDSSYRWAVFKQQARSTLAANSRLDQMVEAVGGDPASFGTRLAKAEYVLAREAPTGVVREKDDEEMFSVSFPVHLGRSASGLFWGVGQLGNGTLTMAASTQDEMERFQ